MAARKGARNPKRSRAPRDEDDDVIEDLDIYVPKASDYNEEHIVNNVRRRKEITELDVQTADAYVREGEGVRGGDGETQLELATATGKKLRSALRDEDFGDLPTVAAAPSSSSRAGKSSGAAAGMTTTTAMLEQVERDFSSVSDSERRAILERESPEVIKLMEEFTQNVAEVRKLAQTLQQRPWLKRHANGGVAAAAAGSLTAQQEGLVTFLHTKLQLLVSYCAHSAFYLLLKADGKKVKGHPVVDRLVELRVYLEKLWTLEQRLQYALNKMLSTEGGAATTAVNVKSLRSVDANGGSEFFQANKTRGTNDESKQRREALHGARLAEEIEKTENATFNRIRGKNSNRAEAALSTLAALQGAAAPNEDKEDVFFAKIAENEDDDDDEDRADKPGAQSLVAKLQSRVAKLNELTKPSAQQKKAAEKKKAQDEAEQKAPAKKKAAAESDEDEDEDAFESGEDDNDFLDADDEDYEAMVAEQEHREQERRAHERETAKRLEDMDEAELNATTGRRHITKKVETHRGLTRARPKDRKNPRIAQRRKYEIGERKAKVTSKPVKAIDSTKFEGVANLKPHLVHSTRIQH